MQVDKVKLLAEFKQLQEIEFYNYEEFDSISVMQSVFPKNWNLEPTNNSKTKYRLVSKSDIAG